MKHASASPTATRRAVICGLGLSVAALATGASAAGDVTAQVQAVERRTGGRVGLAALSLATGRAIGHREGERFPMCSTFKLLAASAVLRRVDEGRESLDRRIAYTRADILPHAPATQAHLAEGAMSVGDLCAAAVTLSDNTAANLLLASLGGPAAVTAFARGLGDGLTRLDRTEPTLNSAIPGDVRDTTTPAAMLADLRRLAVGDALSAASRGHLIDWLVRNQTGDARLRAGFPAGVRVGDKTGTGVNGTANDVAIAWPARGGPLLVSVYITGARIGDAALEGAIAELGRLAYGALVGG